MRDIRDDLQARANFLKEQISAAQAQFEKQKGRIEQEYDSKLKGLKADLDAVNMLLGVEQRRLGGSPPAPKAPLPKAQPQPQPQADNRQPSQPLPTRPRMPLSEMFRLQRAG